MEFWSPSVDFVAMFYGIFISNNKYKLNIVLMVLKLYNTQNNPKSLCSSLIHLMENLLCFLCFFVLVYLSWQVFIGAHELPEIELLTEAYKLVP